MNIDDTFKKKIHLGRAIFLDLETREVVASGHGQFNTEELDMHITICAHAAGEYRKLMLILETDDGYFAPFVTYSRILLLNMTIDGNYPMESCLHWPPNTDILSVSRAFKSIEIIIQAQHSNDSVASTIRPDSQTSRFAKHGITKILNKTEYKGLIASISTGYTLRRATPKSRSYQKSGLYTFMKYRIERSNREGGFRIGDLGKALLAFKLYWINYHDTIDCTITKVKLGDYMTLILKNDLLPAVSVIDRMYRALPAINSPHYIEDLAKIIHFFFNPQKKKHLSSPSKAGLAFIRLIDYRYRTKRQILDMDIASLIFALQSLSESVAEREIRSRNRQTAKVTREGVKQILEKIHEIEATLPENVKKFYLRSEDEIYRNIARPTFMQSLEVALEKLHIDITKHRQMLRAIDKARRQVVHSEGYNADFLLNLLAHSTVKTQVGSDGLARSIMVKRKVSDIDKLYDLLKQMLRAFFAQYEA